MNLLENEEIEQKNKKTKMIITIIITLIILLIIISVALVYLIYNAQQNMLKLTIDGKSVSSIPSDLFLFEDNELYISIKDFAKLAKYESFNGDYKQYSEDTTKCYIQNENEVASYSLNSNKIYKTLRTGNDYEYYDLEKPVKLQNNKLYVSAEGMKIGTNTAISYNQATKQITVYTLPYLTNYYSGKFANSAVAGDKADFSNKKALLSDMIVVMNEEGKYGVRSLDNQEIIGTKYASIKFIESSKEFIVTTDEKKMGILLASGRTKIAPDYDEIKQIDKNLGLYLVTNNKKQGVINQNGNIVIYLEYDKIGIDPSQYTSNNIKNQYLLYDNCIPVQRNKKWGIYDKIGKILVPVEYDAIGCLTGTKSDKANNNTLLVPKYEGIVIGKEDKYGIVTSLGRLLLPVAVESIYSITNAGEETFYMLYQGQNFDLIDYIDSQLKTSQPNQDNNTNTTNEEGQNTTQTPSANETQTNNQMNANAA